jgi:transposase
VNRHSATLFYHKLRELIAAQLAAQTAELLAGEVEVDESYFGGRRKGKRGRGAAGKVPVFGLLIPTLMAGDSRGGFPDAALM